PSWGARSSTRWPKRSPTSARSRSIRSRTAATWSWCSGPTRRPRPKRSGQRTRRRPKDVLARPTHPSTRAPTEHNHLLALRVAPHGGRHARLAPARGRSDATTAQARAPARQLRKPHDEDEDEDAPRREEAVQGDGH